MPIKGIKINNFKSLKNIKINFENNRHDLYCILGKNGSGKSNILDAINYFYNNLIDYNINKDVIDTTNPYTERMEITVVYDLSNLLKKKSNEFIKDELTKIQKYINNNNEICIKMLQYKDNIKSFYPENKELLKFLHRYFPVYLIDTRFITLQNWDMVWEIIGDISQTTFKIENEELLQQLDTAYKNIYGDKYSKTVQILEDIFKKENIDTNKYNYNARYKNIIISRLGGNEFVKDGNKLNYYSDGLNSLNFIKLLIQLIFELSKTGIKEPILIIDEIEIGLHPQYINLLIEIIVTCVNKKTNTLISTHSPSFICELIKSEVSVGIFRVDLYKNYTRIEKMKEIIEEENRSIFTVNESYCYFSNMVVFVEGTSEMQLLSHRKIHNLFAFMNKIDFYSYDSNNTKLKFIYPDKINFKIPYIILIDMDKILSYKKNKFKIKSESLVNPLSSGNVGQKEKLLYYSTNDIRKQRTHYLRNRIYGFIKKYELILDSNLLYINVDLYERLIGYIETYCKEYNIIPARTTIEGIIINNSNIDKVIEWLYEELNEISLLDEILQYDVQTLGKIDIKYRTTIVRVICNGKFDNLKTLKQINSEGMINSELYKNIKEIQKKIGKKTGGWIIKFIDFYFTHYINPIKDNELKKVEFSKDFPELYNILKIIKSMVEL